MTLIEEIMKRLPPQESTPFNMKAYAERIVKLIELRDFYVKIDELRKFGNLPAIQERISILQEMKAKIDVS